MRMSWRCFTWSHEHTALLQDAAAIAAVIDVLVVGWPGCDHRRERLREERERRGMLRCTVAVVTGLDVYDIIGIEGGRITLTDEGWDNLWALLGAQRRLTAPTWSPYSIRERLRRKSAEMVLGRHFAWMPGAGP